MTTNLNTHSRTQTAVLGGAALILFGLLTLAADYFELPTHVVLYAPGAIFTVWGLLARHIGPCIPGGILSGVATGIFLINGPLAGADGLLKLAIMMSSLGAGFFLIALLSLYTERGRIAWWPLIPGGILASMSGLIVGGDTGMKVLEIIGKLWPAALIVVGAYLVLKRKRE